MNKTNKCMICNKKIGNPFVKLAMKDKERYLNGYFCSKRCFKDFIIRMNKSFQKIDSTNMKGGEKNESQNIKK